MELLARTILRAAEIRENSWLENHDQTECGYSISVYDAADKAAEELGLDKSGTQPIYLLLCSCWNNTIEWAQEVVDGISR